MDLNSIKILLRKYKIRPLKKFGQNFLIDKKVIRKIIEVAKLKPDDIVLEIGPGIGNLTIELAKRVREVIAIEKDERMVKILKESLKNFENIKIIKEDILKILSKNLIPLGPQIFKKYKLVANLPFYLTSLVIRKFLEIKNQPQEMILMVQKEVGQRICALPPKMNLLAVSVQFYAKPEILFFVSKKSFWPQPRVDSVIIKIVPRRFRILASHQFREQFFKIVRAGFSQPRKQLINNLSKKLNLDRELVKNWLLKNKIQPTQRAETLSVDDWKNLAKSFKIK